MRSTCVVLLLVGTAAADGGSVANESARASVHAKLGHRLELAGAVLFGAGYVVSAGIAIAQLSTPCGLEPQNDCGNRGAFAAGVAPLVGPWIELGYSHDDASSVALYAVPGAVQIFGVALIVTGAVIRHRAERGR